MTDRRMQAGDTPPPTSEELAERFGRDIFADFDIDDPRFNDQFYDALDEMVAHCPVVRSSVGKGYYMVTRQEDVRRVGQDWRTFSSAKGFQPNRPDGLPYLLPEESDPPFHTAWRRLLNPFVTPKAVAEHADGIRADINALIDGFIDRGSCEFVSEFAAKVPGYALCRHILHVPLDALDQLVRAIDSSLVGPVEGRAENYAFVFDYLNRFLKERSEQPPQGDLVDAILKGPVHDDGTPAAWDEKVSIVADLCFGGLATTTYVMADAVRYLAQNPATRKQLVEAPETIGRAVEEFVRVFPPVVALGRTCTRDVEVAGTALKENDFLLLGYAASSRDPSAVANATEIDITRETVVHSAFGVGPHRCVGSNLARLELKLVFEELLRRIPAFSICADMPATYETGILRTIKQLHLEF